MNVNVLTLFPEMFSSFLENGIISRAIKSKLLDIELINFRDYGFGRHRHVDDTPYGGGAGMVLRPEPIANAIQACEENTPNQKVHKILITPQGMPFRQERARQLSQLDGPLLFICGRYEGFDERIRDLVDEELSIGDVVLLGGEVPAMMMIEAISRLKPGVIGNQESLDHESFGAGLLEYAQYTKPPEFMGNHVPEVLLSGNHQKIAEWRKQSALEKTQKRRPDLYLEFCAKQKTD